MAVGQGEWNEAAPVVSFLGGAGGCRIDPDMRWNILLEIGQDHVTFFQILHREINCLLVRIGAAFSSRPAVI